MSIQGWSVVAIIAVLAAICALWDRQERKRRKAQPAELTAEELAQLRAIWHEPEECTHRVVAAGDIFMVAGEVGSFGTRIMLTAEDERHAPGQYAYLDRPADESRFHTGDTTW